MTKSQIVVEIKPWDTETNLEELTQLLSNKQLEGLEWGEMKIESHVYGVKKLKIAIVIEDEKVSSDDIEELITSEEDYVQSVDIVAWNHLGKSDNEKSSNDHIAPLHQSTGSYSPFYSFACHGVKGLRNTMEDASITECNIMHGSNNSQESSPVISCFAVFDGHGGDNCSNYLKDNWIQYCQSALITTTTIENSALEDLFITIDTEYEKLHKAKYSTNTIQNTVGSTANVLFVIHGNNNETMNQVELVCCNSGDTRCVLYNNGTIEVLSEDHKPDNPIEKERIEACNGAVMFGRVVGLVAVSRAFGDYMFKEHESGVNKRKQMITALPDITRVQFTINNNTSEQDQQQSFAIIGCDGVWDVMTNEEAVQFILDRLSQNKSIDQIAKELCEYCVLDKRSTDNISVVIVVFGSQ